tara:strand:- start:5246 stop:9142 length:3897 start_codon:yes stop_codon:yes gene_type:complete
MSRRNPTGGYDPPATNVLPFLGSLSLVDSADISAPKRKNKVPLPEESPDAPELTQSEREDLERTAVSYMMASSQVLVGSSLQEAETLSQRIPVSLFAYNRERLQTRRDIFASVLNSRFWKKKVWGKPGDAVPVVESSVIRLLQSIKGYDYAAAHHPLDQELPPSFSPSDANLVQSHRRILKAAVAMTKGSIPEGVSAEDSVTQADLESFETQLGGVVLFGDVQTAPVHERDNIIAYLDGKIDQSPVVDVVTVSIMRSHFELMYSMTLKILQVADDNTEFKAAMDAMEVDAFEAIPGVAGRLYNHVVADLSAPRSSEATSRMVRAYWELLRQIVFSLPAVGSPTELEIDEDGEAMRKNAPSPEEIGQFRDMYDALKRSSTRTDEEKTELKVAFMKMVVRVAAYKGWSWFAQSSLNLYTLHALMVREARWQTESARLTQQQASASATAILAKKTPEQRDAALKEAADKAGAPPSGLSEMLEQTGLADASTSGDAADDEEELPAAAPIPEEDDGSPEAMDSETAPAATPSETLSTAIVVAASSNGFLQEAEQPRAAMATRGTVPTDDDVETTVVDRLEPTAPSGAEACSQNSINAVRLQLSINTNSKETMAELQAARDRLQESEAKQAEAAEKTTQLQTQLADATEAKKQVAKQLRAEKAKLDELRAKATSVAEKNMKMTEDRRKAEAGRKEAENATLEKITELEKVKQQAIDAETELKEEANRLRQEIQALKDKSSDADQDTSDTISQLLQKVTEGLDSLKNTAANVPPSSVANAQYEKDKKEIEEAKAKIKDLKARLAQLHKTSGDEHKQLLDQIEEVIKQVSGTVEDQKEGWLEGAWQWMKAQGDAIDQAFRDPKLADKAFGHANALFSNSKTFFLALSLLRRRMVTINDAFPDLRKPWLRPEPMEGLFEIDSADVLAALFSLGSFLLVRAQNAGKQPEEKASWNRYVFLYQGAVQLWGQMTGNLVYGYRSFLPITVRNYILRLLGGSAAIKVTQMSAWDVLLEGGLNLATITAFKYGAPLMLKSLGMNALLGKNARYVTEGMSTGFLILEKVYMIQSVAQSWSTIKQFADLPLRIYQHIRVGPIQVIIDRGAQTATMFLNGLRFIVSVPYNTLVAIGNLVSSHPALAIACVLVGFSLGYAQKKYRVLDKAAAKGKATYAEVVKRARMLQPAPENGGRFTRRLRRAAADTAGPSSDASADTMQVDERRGGDADPGEGMADDDDDDDLDAADSAVTADGMEDDTEATGAENGIESSVAEMAKLKGVKIADSVCGNFVVVSKPSKKPPRVSACLALILNT